MTDRPQRWSQAVVYPDMWLDPDDDPRDDGFAGAEGELATLQAYLTNYRLTLLMKCDGLDAEQLAYRSVPPSNMSLLGLVRHLAKVERDWSGWIQPGDPPSRLYGAHDGDFEGAVADPAVVDSAFADLAREQAATDAVLAEHPDLGERVGKDGISIRELLVHRIEEYARHCGSRRSTPRVHRRSGGPVTGVGAGPAWGRGGAGVGSGGAGVGSGRGRRGVGRGRVCRQFCSP